VPLTAPGSSARTSGSSRVMTSATCSGVSSEPMAPNKLRNAWPRMRTTRALRLATAERGVVRAVFRPACR
jgi:hypothetical protein